MTRPRELLKILAMVGLVLLAVPLATPSAKRASTTVLVRMSGDAYERLRSEIHLAVQDPSEQALDYGSFVWLEVEKADLDNLRASGLSMDIREEPYTLRLGEQSFDPLRDTIQQPVGWDTSDSDGPDLHLVQIAGPPRDECLEDLRLAGLEPVQYISPFTYVVWGQPEALERAASANRVRWTGTFVAA